MEITSEEQNKVKRMKRTDDSLRDVWDHIRCTNVQITGVPKEEEKKKGYEKIFELIIVENFPNMEEEVVVNHSQSVQEEQSPIQDKTKDKHAKTYTNQTNRDKTQRKIIKISKGEATSNIQGKPCTLNS